MKFRSDLKLIVIGTSGTGKTNLVNKWTKNTFTDTYKATIVSEFGFKIFENEKKLYRIQLWDLAGQDKNAMVTKIFAKDAQGVIVLSDATNIETREDAIKWKSSVDEVAVFFDGGKIPALLVESKCDLLDNPEVEDETLQEFAKVNNFIGSFRVSSKTGLNVAESIEFLIKNIIKRMEDMQEKGTDPFYKIEEKDKKKEKREKNGKKGKNQEEEEDSEEDDSSEIDVKDVNFFREEENLEIEIRKDGKKYFFKMDFKKFKEKYEVFIGVKDIYDLIEILDELKDRDRIIVNYYLKNVVIQIGILCFNLLGEKEDIYFELIHEDLEDEDIFKYLIKELKRLKDKEEKEDEKDSNNKKNKSINEEEKKSAEDEKNIEKDV